MTCDGGGVYSLANARTCNSTGICGSGTPAGSE